MGVSICLVRGKKDVGRELHTLNNPPIVPRMTSAKTERTVLYLANEVYGQLAVDCHGFVVDRLSQVFLHATS